MSYLFKDTNRYSSEYGRYGDTYRSPRSYHNSRSFDCCMPVPWYAEYDYSPTYGTYVWEPRRSKDPSDCPCTCCPHSYAGARRAAGSRRNSSYEAHPYSSSYHSYDPAPSRSKSQSRKKTQGPTHILVENKTDGSLRQRYGSQFPIGITRDMTAKAILSFLAPDRHRYKVVVHWDDNTKEDLEDWISVSELRQYASHLEVKKKKRVRFAA